MWYLIDTGFKDPYFNMAYDESLMDYVNDKNTVFLRFFNFLPNSVSLGYHQNTGDWLRALEKQGFMWVRRQTGGRAIIHSHDCTYSLVFHRDNPVMGGSVVESYRKVSSAFKKAFELLGIKTSVKRGTLSLNEGLDSEMCFSSKALSDLCWENKKIIGSAQYRNKDVILQQGTIMLETPTGFPPGKGMATLRMAAGKEIALDEVKSLVIQAFEKVFDVSFEKFDKNPLKKKLLLKYSSPDWNFRGGN